MLVQCFVFGAGNAGKSSLLQGLVRKRGQPGSGKIEPKEEEESAGQAPAANIAVNEIPVARGNRQREGPTHDPRPLPLPPPHPSGSLQLMLMLLQSLWLIPHMSVLLHNLCRPSGLPAFA